MPEIGKWEATTQLTVLTGDVTTADNQNLKLVPNGTGIVQIGDAGTTNRGLSTNDDLFVSGQLEVDGYAHFDAAVGIYSAMTVLNDCYLRFGDEKNAIFEWDLSETNDALKISVACGAAHRSGNIIICEKGDAGVDFGHPIASNPTLYIQSADATSPSEYLKLYHDQINGQIMCGSGDLCLTSLAGSVCLSASTGRIVAYRGGVQSYFEIFDPAGLAHTHITHNGIYGSVYSNTGAIRIRGVGGTDLQDTGGVGMRIPTSVPASPAAGSMYFDATTNVLYCHNGTAWVSVTLS